MKLGATLHPEPKLAWDFSSGPVVKTSPSNAEGMGSIPGRGTKLPCAVHCGQNIEEEKKKKNLSLTVGDDHRGVYSDSCR